MNYSMNYIYAFSNFVLRKLNWTQLNLKSHICMHHYLTFVKFYELTERYIYVIMLLKKLSPPYEPSQNRKNRSTTELSSLNSPKQLFSIFLDFILVNLLSEFPVLKLQLSGVRITTYFKHKDKYNFSLQRFLMGRIRLEFSSHLICYVRLAEFQIVLFILYYSRFVQM